MGFLTFYLQPTFEEGLQIILQMNDIRFYRSIFKTEGILLHLILSTQSSFIGLELLKYFLHDLRSKEIIMVVIWEFSGERWIVIMEASTSVADVVSLSIVMWCHHISFIVWWREEFFNSLVRSLGILYFNHSKFIWRYLFVFKILLSLCRKSWSIKLLLLRVFFLILITNFIIFFLILLGNNIKGRPMS